MPNVTPKRTSTVIKKEKLVEVGNNIRKWRTLKGFKQDFLASELEISKVAISRIETGKTDIPLNRLFQIASALDIKIELLFSDPFAILLAKEQQ